MVKHQSSLLSRLSRPVELTAGTPWKVILRYAAPIMLSYLLQQIYVLTDAIICGQVLSVGEVAGVNDTYPLTFIFLQFAFGCTSGFGVLTARYAGCGEKAGVRRSLVAQIYLSVAISAVLTALSLLLLPWMLGVIHVTPTNKEVYDAAYIYCFVIFLGIAAQMGYNFICGILRSLGDSGTPLLFLVVSTALNVGLDLLFLLGFRMGPAGAAIATVIAQLLSMVGCFAYTFFRYPELRPQKTDWRVPFAAMWAHLRQGIPQGLQFSILAIGIIVMHGAVVKFDLTAGGLMVANTPAQNGFGAANKLVNFLMAAFSGLGTAMLGYNAQNYGKGDFARIRKGTLQSLLLMVGISAVCLAAGLLLSIHGAYQYIFMSADKVTPESVRFGNTFLKVDICLYVFLGFLIVVRAGVQGIGRAGFVLGAGMAELVARVLICTFLPPLVNGGAIDATASTLAFAAVCFGDPGAWILASLVILPPFFRCLLGMHYPEFTSPEKQ